MIIYRKESTLWKVHVRMANQGKYCVMKFFVFNFRSV